MKSILRLLTGTVALASVACGLEPVAAPVGTTSTPSVASQEGEPGVATPTSTVAPPQDDVGTPAPSTEDQIARLEERLGSLTYNDDDKIMLEISKRVPDWGGYYMDEAGIVHVYMIDTAADEEMKADIAEALSGVVWGYVIDHEGTATEQRLSLTADDIVVHQGQYTMLQLLEWYWLSDFMPVLGLPGRGATGLGISGNHLVLDLAAKEHRDGALANLRVLGIPEEAVNISITGPAVPDVGPPDLWGGSDPPTPTPSPDDQIARLEERLGELKINHDDKIMLEISKGLPEWGGYFVDEDRKTHVYMIDPSAAEDMKPEIAEALSGVVWGYSTTPDGTTESRLSLTADDIVIEQAQYTMLQLLEWYWLTDFMPVLMRPGNGGVGSAVAEGSNRLILDLETEEHREGVMANLREMDIPPEAVHISITGRPIPYSAPPLG